MMRKKEVPAFVERRRARERWAILAKHEMAEAESHARAAAIRAKMKPLEDAMHMVTFLSAIR